MKNVIPVKVWLSSVILLCLFGSFACSPTAMAVDIRLEYLMDSDPSQEHANPSERVNPQLKALWLRALSRPEAELQRQAADAFAKAYDYGMHDVGDVADQLQKILEAPETSLVVRYSAARTLIRFDHRDSASLLFKQTATGSLDMAMLIEPALANWKYEPIYDVWMERINNTSARGQRLMLAIQGLGKTAQPLAEPRLVELAMSSAVPASIRLESARALAQISSQGLEDESSQLLDDPSPDSRLDRLVGVSMLVGHSSGEATSKLLELLNDAEPAVVALAADRLLEIAPESIAEKGDFLLAHPDANVRQLGIQALLQQPSPEGVELVGQVLNDRHPDVRNPARHALLSMATEHGLGESVRQIAMDVLAGDTWQGLEQAIVLLVLLDHKVVADRVIELLDHPRPEVFVAAAWGLHRFQVPETVDAIFDKAQRWKAAVGDPNLYFEREVVQGMRVQLAFLIQALTLMDFKDHEQYLREMLPKRTDDFYGTESRAAAMWSLGHLYADNLQPDLERIFIQRYNDTQSDPPEAVYTRQYAAVALGLMKSQRVAELVRSSAGLYDNFSVVMWWIINHVTGEEIPEPEPFVVDIKGWFLEPNEVR